MNWFYAAGQERKGPLPEAQLKELIAAGTVRAETLVWNETLTDWVPLKNTALAGPPPLPDENSQVCIITGRVFPKSQMFETTHGWVSAEGKDTYYQCLREGVPFPAAGSQTNARVDGKRVVVPLSNTRLPMRCFKTNLPVTAEQVRLRKLYWCSPWVYLSLFLSLIVLLVVYLISRKLVKVELPLSPTGKGIVRKQALIAWGIFVGGIVLSIAGFANDFPSIGVIGILAIPTSMIYGIVKASTVRVIKIKDGDVWLAGAGKDFLASLPAYS
jgi:hypothetical protein